jgi:hypothetical protein
LIAEVYYLRFRFLLQAVDLTRYGLFYGEHLILQYYQKSYHQYYIDLFCFEDLGFGEDDDDDDAAAH